MKIPTILAIAAIIAVASMPLLSMATSVHAKDTKPWPRDNSQGFTKNPNHFREIEPGEADNSHCINTPSGNQNCQ